MIAIDIGNNTWPLPENWTEVVQSGKYLDVVEVNYTHTPQQAAEARLEVFKRLSGINGFDMWKSLQAATPEDRKEIADNIGLFMASQVMDEIFPVLDFIFTPELLTVNPLPVIEHKGVSYYGPTEKMATQTGAEMEECGYAHAEYIKTGEEKYLDTLVAALYRPKKLFSDKPEKFSKEITEKQTLLFAGLDPLVKRGVLLFYQMCEEWWKESFEFLYDKPASPADTEDVQIDSLATSRIVRALAGNKRGIVSQVREMERQEIYFELAELERERKAADK